MSSSSSLVTITLILLAASSLFAQSPSFRAQTIDPAIQIGYGLAIADVQGDGKPDILLADKTQIVWYQNPTWQKHVIAENLTEKDNVCIAARDLDGDGKCEIAVGSQWNPSDTVNSGAVFYLVPPADRTQKWEPVQLHHEPTVHRMKWVQRSKNRFDLVVVPLHGHGNKAGEGEGVKVLAYQKPANPKDEWKTEVINDDMHLTHNFDVVEDSHRHSASLVIGGKEGLIKIDADPQSPARLQTTHFVDHTKTTFPDIKGVGEVRRWLTPDAHGWATIEAMHGNQLALYTNSVNTAEWQRQVLTDTLTDGHALASADVLGLGHDQIIVGWRAMSNRLTKVGIKLFIPKNKDGLEWESYLIDDNTMACEDLLVADLNADGKPDIIASGRRTQNVIIYWNKTIPSTASKEKQN